MTPKINVPFLNFLQKSRASLAADPAVELLIYKRTFSISVAQKDPRDLHPNK